MTKAIGWLIIAALLFVALSIAAAGRLANPGRYQIMQRQPSVIILVDTKTGRCWENGQATPGESFLDRL